MRVECSRFTSRFEEVRVVDRKTGAKDKKKTTRKMPSMKRMERDIRFILMDLMALSDSDSVRVAAAKALLDRIHKDQGEDADASSGKAEERKAAIEEASRLLDELAVAQSRGARRKAALA